MRMCDHCTKLVQNIASVHAQVPIMHCHLQHSMSSAQRKYHREQMNEHNRTRKYVKGIIVMHAYYYACQIEHNSIPTYIIVCRRGSDAWHQYH